MSTQVFSHSLRLNDFRENCGYNFCSWQNVKKHIDKQSDNALALVFTPMHYKPFVFKTSNNKVLSTQFSCEESEFCDKEFIESKFKGNDVNDIFVVGTDELKFRGFSDSVVLTQEKKIDGDCGSLYDHARSFAGRPTRKAINLYHFNSKDKLELH